MARVFNGTTQYLSNGLGLLDAVPVTLACWFNTAAIGSLQTLIQVYNSADTDCFRLALSATGHVLAYEADAGGPTNQGTATTSTAATANAWHHAAAVFTTNASRAAYLDGAGVGTDTTAVNVPGLDTTRVAAAAGPSLYFHGSIAVLTIWRTALAAADIVSLASGVSPLVVQPTLIKHHWRLYGTFSPEPENLPSGQTLTLNNAPTQGTDPPNLAGPGRMKLRGPLPKAPPLPPTPLTPPVLPNSIQWRVHRIDLKPRREEHT